jgi:hypothetical protein
MTLINKLPPEWDWVKVSWLPKPATERSFNTLIDTIMGEAARRESENLEQTTAFLSRMTLSSRKPRRPHSRLPQPRVTTFLDKTELKCRYCKRTGDTEKVCFRRKRRAPRSPRRKSKHTGEAFVVQVCTSTEANLAAHQISAEFILDTGSTHHVLNDKKWFVDFKPHASTREVKLGGAYSLKSKGEGTARLTVRNGKKLSTLFLSNALYVPNMRRNLISVGKLTDFAHSIQTSMAEMKILFKGHVRATAPRRFGLYILRAEGNPVSSFVTEGNLISLKKMHEALAHVGKLKTIRTLQRLNFAFYDDLPNCEACLQGKQRRSAYKSKPKASISTCPGTIHADLCSATPPSLGRANHFLCMTDEFSKFRKVYFLKTKDETPNCI